MAKSKKHSAVKRKSVKSPKSAKRTKAALRSVKRRAPSKSHGRQRAARIHQPERRPVKRMVTAERDPQAVKLYENALKSFTHQDFVRAGDIFQKIVEQFPKETEIVERSRMHVRICKNRLGKSNANLKTAEDYYLLAVAHLNRRECEQAKSALEKAMTMQPKGDHIFYGLAVLESLQNNPEQALKHLQRAIQLNPANRLTAMRDSDFERLATLPEFQALVRESSSGS
jgi:tetratricopeptide (TPR) repeat protein